MYTVEHYCTAGQKAHATRPRRARLGGGCKSNTSARAGARWGQMQWPGGGLHGIWHFPHGNLAPWTGMRHGMQGSPRWEQHAEPHSHHSFRHLPSRLVWLEPRPSGPTSTANSDGDAADEVIHCIPARRGKSSATRPLHQVQRGHCCYVCVDAQLVQGDTPCEGDWATAGHAVAQFEASSRTLLKAAQVPRCRIALGGAFPHLAEAKHPVPTFWTRDRDHHQTDPSSAA